MLASGGGAVDSNRTVELPAAAAAADNVVRLSVCLSAQSNLLVIEIRRTKER